MKAMIKRFVREEDGAAGVEYALLLAFVALVMVASGGTVKTAVGAIWSTIATQLSTAAA
ncbi:Flp family type IVb pilin [Ralstonia insidiosa]|uniref:Flp/Fap pilin component family protein n=1 Tax=Ralstonia insidiosa TaxID=190721 RepID=A0A191ZTZ6_9RALS|nr:MULTISPECIES: Flp family type IVb pilin [Ralstonia]ANH71474.1 flp/Fap pilin component family protein [Ralstonia insidiosa]ANJ71552.1 pili assembly chaperone [Ralstonia insidiosa]EPX96010.1 pili assembly chaperone [Ralstonia sp. AU12-08]KAB0472151.1 Flp family type IVb pilin [Ralstonia insidiosa]MBY4706723.1 Flp family type IVb pilin [Ralstonia insidiosa]